MKRELILVSTKGMSAEEWLRYRKRGIGASEVGTILGLNPYKCSAQLFYEKMGEDLGVNVENMAMFMGHFQEPAVAELWQYWEGDQESVIRNFREGKIIRRCQRVNAYVNNPAFPWLFVSLDRKINRLGDIGEGALELKTIAGWEADKWEAGIPPSHVVQVQTQLMVCGFNFGELAILKDGRTLDVIPFEADRDIQNTIKTRTYEFWQRVEAGRILLTRQFEAQRLGNYQLFNSIGEELTAIEPPADGSEAFAKYLKVRYQIAEPGLIPGNDETLTLAVKDKQLKEQMDAIELQRLEVQNKLKNALRDKGEKIDFGENGYWSWATNAKGSRVARNGVKSV